LLVASGRNYEFANDVLREVVYATTPEPTRLAHHLRAVDLLADRPEQVAVHAMAIEDWPRAARAWLVAAQHALDGFAAADAVSLAGNAIDAAERSASDELSARSFLIRGRAYYASGEYPKSWRDLADAVAAARAAGDARLEMVALREQSHDLHVALGYPPADSEGPMRECLRIAESLGDRAREADVLNRLAVLAISRLDFVNALDLGERALRIGRTTGKTRAVIYGLDAVKTANAYLGETPRLSEIIAELEPLLRADGDLLLLQWTVFESFVMPLARGDRDGARARLEAGLALNRRSGLTAMEPFFVAHLGWLHRLFGELETAAEVGARAVAIGREHPHAWWQATAATTYASTLTALGRNAEAAREVERVLPLVDAAGIEAYRLRCLAALAASTDSTDVLREADELLHSVRAPDGCAWLLGADAYLGVASAWVARGDVGRARDALAPMRTAARRLPWPTLVRMADAVVPG
jgi:tetratricopeptide (TPR) repeat protein